MFLPRWNWFEITQFQVLVDVFDVFCLNEGITGETIFDSKETSYCRISGFPEVSEIFFEG
jgi:hypothetical protein